MDFSGFGKYAGRLGKVKEFLCEYKLCAGRDDKENVLKVLASYLDDCPFGITKLLLAEAIRQLGFDVSTAVTVVGDYFTLCMAALIGGEYK